MFTYLEQQTIVIDTTDLSVKLCEDFNWFLVLQTVPCHRHPDFLSHAILLDMKRPILLQFAHPFFFWQQENNAPIIGPLYASFCLFDRLVFADGDIIA